MWNLRMLSEEINMTHLERGYLSALGHHSNTSKHYWHKIMQILHN